MMKDLYENSYLYSANAPFVEARYAEYLRDPGSVGEDWRDFFRQMQTQGLAPEAEPDHTMIREEFARLTRQPRALQLAAAGATPSASCVDAKQVAVLQLINAYRFRGHQNADLDPLHLREEILVPELHPAFHKLDDDDMNQVFNTGSLVGPERAPLRDILRSLRRIYCGHLGVEYMHITDTQEKRWLQQRLEGPEADPLLEESKQREIMERIVAASEFEKYLHTRYVGQKRFSLEGAECLIPLLHQLVQQAGEQGISEVVLGMAHRGRLNVLTNILGKAPASLFEEFEGKSAGAAKNGSGDVKYHQGFSSDIRTPGGIVHFALLFNPSHLEIVDPVVGGSVRARQHRRKDTLGNSVLPVLIHGDAAFSGQGVVMENFNMSQARGFSIGGTVHIIINNQIGFTTSNPLDSRSTTYCTEVARMIQAPILHVNGDDPEAVARAICIALDFRMVYHKDVVVDLVCYRRHGHSEADEPAATQPMMYKKIRHHARVGQLYADLLVDQGVMTEDDIDALTRHYRERLDAGETVAPSIVTEAFDKPYWVDWRPYLDGRWDEDVDTRIVADKVEALITTLNHLPENLVLHKQVRRILDDRLKMARGELSMDWGFAETLAYASLLEEGYSVRLSGQDSGRGTFFHRHAILHDQQTGHSHVPLQNLYEGQPDFVAIDSLLSEEAVLGFEYGYSTAAPYGLNIWEAQFGDFANGAQVVIDQFITSGAAKWGRLSGLVMFLPHGFDGQGPEHSSARIERYLQLCAEDNVQVCMPSEPAQMFHLLRRQMKRRLRTPLIVMTPKSLLRHKLSTSHLVDLSEGDFRLVISDPDISDVTQVRRVVVCSGKVFYDLLDARRKRNIDDVAIIRIEQFYPFPTEAFCAELDRYIDAAEVVWCQEEPQNQGAWQYIRPMLRDSKRDEQNLLYAGRQASASPAVGSYRKHIEQLHELLDTALGSRRRVMEDAE
ncbi:MAG: 2-oxoglutarate dehydrogenase E1 component [Gammaproteobacteria bacterium]|nr:2-oxoglutarate dehydrogenase E1 component [Gammaproteobacteria bacterium]MCF6362008.1 2-oxoglutarate dehydrogenase E1 component [Gammaproteobacteria bacterium]